MLFAESHARLLLLAHTILAAALVASATHLVVWMRGFPRRSFHRLGAVRRFAVITAVLFILTAVVGNLIYPVYKVRVRFEYLENPDAVLRDAQRRAATRDWAESHHRALVTGSYQQVGPAPDLMTPADAAAQAVAAQEMTVGRQAAKIARWFDVKEHWAALGAMLAIGCALVLRVWHPKRHDPGIAPLVFLMAVGVALVAWFGAIVGVVVSSYRSVAGLGG